MTDTHAAERRAQTLLLLVVVFWAANSSLVKAGLGYMEPLVFNAVRYLIAAFTLLVILRSRSEWKRIAPDDRRSFFTLGFVGSFLYQIVFIFGLSYTSAGNSAVLISTAPLWTAFLSSRINKESIPAKAVWGMIISIAGIVLILIGSGKNIDFGGDAMKGDILSLSAAFLWAVTTTLQKPLLESYSTFQIATGTVGIGAVFLTLSALPVATSVAWTSVSPVAFAIAAVSGVLSTGVGNLFWAYGVKWLGPRRTSGFNNLVPVIAFLISWVVFDEQILPVQVAGAGLTIVGVWVARR